jgi:hypothetical protein
MALARNVAPNSMTLLHVDRFCVEDLMASSPVNALSALRFVVWRSARRRLAPGPHQWLFDRCAIW